MGSLQTAARCSTLLAWIHLRAIPTSETLTFRGLVSVFDLNDRVIAVFQEVVRTGRQGRHFGTSSSLRLGVRSDDVDTCPGAARTPGSVEPTQVGGQSTRARRPRHSVGHPGANEAEPAADRAVAQAMGSVRGGPALAAGWVFCGRCNRRMTVRSGRAGATVVTGTRTRRADGRPRPPQPPPCRTGEPPGRPVTGEGVGGRARRLAAAPEPRPWARSSARSSGWNSSVTTHS